MATENKCKHEWNAFEGSHIINDGVGSPESMLVYEKCDKCKSIKKVKYNFIEE